ncbi:MAG: hypothetical protein UU41_C0004G0002 [Candidatus Roizmanbacteria bacterium GW2011_GWA1_41_13]|uniref:Uncharacterized protein n=1 Tax=Candidatus Roizmanbacteria bacterium GW2011_GWA1_41_13 TaxID=1618474 RepID=A0A0G0Y397_9BACT|nr:MAG: hypothetical protein UU41_C0004G0002 [Candidatus Roizmanbacteria bacterium GW2011_GWA1_41_13]
MRNRNDFCGILSTNRFATYAPSNEIGTQSIRVISNDLSSIILLRTYWVNRELSINKPIAPDVKRNTDFSRLNAERKVLLTAPPTPNIPAKNPVDAEKVAFILNASPCSFFSQSLSPIRQPVRVLLF